MGFGYEMSNEYMMADSCTNAFGGVFLPHCTHLHSSEPRFKKRLKPKTHDKHPLALDEC